MDSVYYTRSTLASDYFDFYSQNDALNVIKIPGPNGPRLVSPDNELLAEKTLIQDNFKLHDPKDEIDVEEADKYFIEIAWYDGNASCWYSAILIPKTWNDVLISLKMCEGKEYLSESKPTATLKMKELYPLSTYKNPKLVRQCVDSAKISLDNNAHHIYITRGLYSGILVSKKYENMVHKSELDSTTFVWISAWKLQRDIVYNTGGSLISSQPFNRLV